MVLLLMNALISCMTLWGTIEVYPKSGSQVHLDLNILALSAHSVQESRTT